MDSSIRQNLLDRLLAYLDGGEFLAFSLTPSAIALIKEIQTMIDENEIVKAMCEKYSAAYRKLY